MYGRYECEGLYYPTTPSVPRPCTVCLAVSQILLVPSRMTCSAAGLTAMICLLGKDPIPSPRIMNAKDTIAYFRSIGLELTPSTQAGCRWTMKGIDGYGLSQHYPSLKFVRGRAKLAIQSHFQQAHDAKKVLVLTATKSHPGWVDVDRWFHDETGEMEFPPSICSPTTTDHPLPLHWRSAYANLIGPHGSPEMPLFGRIMNLGMIALHMNDPSFCPRVASGCAHGKHKNSVSGPPETLGSQMSI